MTLASDSHSSASPATQLTAAAAGSDADKIQQALADGANPNSKMDEGTPVLHVTMLTNNRRAFETLLDAGADPSQTDSGGDNAVHVAAALEDSWWLQNLLERGASPNAGNNQTGITPIMDAVMNHRDANIDLLLRAGADVNQTDGQGNTALHVSAKTNIAKYVLKFLEAGADPHAKNALDANFQTYLFMTPDALLNADIQRDREAIRYWLHVNHIPIEDSNSQ